MTRLFAWTMLACIAMAGVGHAQDAVAPTAPPAVFAPASVSDLFSMSMKNLSAAADAGDAAAALAIARAKFADEDIKTQAEGVPFLEKAAAQGAVEANLMLGDIYAKGGYGIAPNLANARLQYEKAVEAGSVDALAALGKLLLNSDFTAAGQQRGIDLLLQSVASGQISAANTLGQLYADGRGVPADMEKAIYYFSMGLVADSVSSVLSVGDLMRAGAPGIAANPAVALELFQKAALTGDNSASRRIADMHIRGEAVASDVAGGEQMLRDLAAAGDTSSLLALGDLYRDGEFVASDPAKAIAFYQQAADQSNSSGLTRLASLYLEGARGTPVDVLKSMALFTSAADMGNNGARRAMAGLYLDGNVVVANPEKAIDLLETATSFGDGDAAEQLAILHANNDPFPASYDDVKKNLDLALVMGNSRAVLDVAAAIAEGPLARQHGDEAFQLLQGAVAGSVPGAAAKLAKLQLDGRFPSQGVSGVMSMLSTAALGGDKASAKFLARLYRDGYGLLLKPDPSAADAFLTAIEPVLGEEGAAIERIALAAEKGDSIENLKQISALYSKVTPANGVSVLNDLRRVNARAYVYVLQVRLLALNIYTGGLTGLLDNTTIRAFRKACVEANSEKECAPGPLTAGSARVLATFVANSGFPET